MGPREVVSNEAVQYTFLPEGSMLQVSLYKILFHFKALLWEPIILLLRV